MTDDIARDGLARDGLARDGLAREAERLAALLDGRLDAAARARLLDELAAAPDDLEALGDAAAVLREVEGDAVAERPAAPARALPGRPRRRWPLGVGVLAAAAVAAVVVAPLVRHPTRIDADDPAAMTALLAGSDGATLPASPWRVSRGGDADGLSPDARAVRVGARLMELEIAVTRRDTAAAQAARDVAALLAPVPGSGPATTIYADIATRAGAIPHTLGPMLVTGWRAVIAMLPPDATRRGAWLEAARVAAVRHDTAFFRAPSWERSLGTMASMGTMTHEAAAQIRAAASTSEWEVLERSLGDQLASSGR